jgi:hypothetical protein
MYLINCCNACVRIHLTEEGQWSALVDTVMNLRVLGSIRSEEFLGWLSDCQL